MTAPVSQVLSEAAEKVTPNMEKAWVDYEPAHDVVGNRSLSNVSAALRHAFMSGWLAALAKEQGR